MTSSVSQWNSGDWDLNKSYSNMKDSYNKFEKDVTDGILIIKFLHSSIFAFSSPKFISLIIRNLDNNR